MTTAAPPSTKWARKAPLAYVLSGAVALLLGAVADKIWGLHVSRTGALLSLRIFFELYLGWLIAVVLSLAGITALLIGIVAAGVQIGMRSSRRTP